MNFSLAIGVHLCELLPITNRWGYPMRSIITAAAVVLALAGNAAAQSADWDDQRRNSLTPSYGDIAKGVGSALWNIIRGLDGGYSGSGNNTGNYGVGGKDRAR